MKDQLFFTRKEMKEAMMRAFCKGEQWGATYEGWFNPTTEEKADRASKDCESVYKNILTRKI